MSSFYLKLLVPKFNEGTLLERLPDELLEIITKDVIKKRNNLYLKENTDNINLQGSLSRIKYFRFCLTGNTLDVTKFINDYYIFINPRNLALKVFCDPIHILSCLNKCKCCERHQKHRATHINKYEYFPLSNTNAETLKKHRKNCGCFCRAISRYINELYTV